MIKEAQTAGRVSLLGPRSTFNRTTIASTSTSPIHTKVILEIVCNVYYN